MPNPGAFGFPRRWRRSAGSGLVLPVGAADHDLLEVDGSELAAVSPTAGKYLRFKADASGYEWASPGGSGGSVTIDTYANRPTGAEGAVFYPTDGYIRQVHDGTEWLNDIHGRLATPPPAAANWGWNNQGSATIADVGSTLVFTPNGSGQWRGPERAVPTAPYTVTACFRLSPSTPVNQWFAMWWRESGTSELEVNGFAGANVVGVAANWGKYHSRWTNNTTFSAHLNNGNWGQGLNFSPCLWLQLEDDATNRTARWSLDGVTWLSHPAVSNATFLTPDKVGFGTLEGATFAYTPVHLLSWEEVES